IRELFSGTVVLWSALRAQATAALNGQVLKECWSFLDCSPRVVVGEPWTEEAFAILSQHAGKTASAALRVRRVGIENSQVVLDSSRMFGKLHVKQRLALQSSVTFWITLATEAEIEGESAKPPATTPGVQRWAPRLERFYGQDEIQRLLAYVKEETGLVRLADADFVIDVGFGVGNRDGYEAVIVPLERALRELGVRNLVVGGSRKVTEEL